MRTLRRNVRHGVLRPARGRRARWRSPRACWTWPSACRQAAQARFEEGAAPRLDVLAADLGVARAAGRPRAGAVGARVGPGRPQRGPEPAAGRGLDARRRPGGGRRRCPTFDRATALAAASNVELLAAEREAAIEDRRAEPAEGRARPDADLHLRPAVQRAGRVQRRRARRREPRHPALHPQPGRDRRHRWRGSTSFTRAATPLRRTVEAQVFAALARIDGAARAGGVVPPDARAHRRPPSRRWPKRATSSAAAPCSSCSRRSAPARRQARVPAGAAGTSGGPRGSGGGHWWTDRSRTACARRAGGRGAAPGRVWRSLAVGCASAASDEESASADVPTITAEIGTVTSAGPRRAARRARHDRRRAERGREDQRAGARPRDGAEGRRGRRGDGRAGRGRDRSAAARGPEAAGRGGAWRRRRPRSRTRSSTSTRTERLFKRGIAAGKEVEDARAQHAAAEAAVEQAHGRRSTPPTASSSRTKVTSPIAGQVVKRLVERRRAGGRHRRAAAARGRQPRRASRLAANVPSEHLAASASARPSTIVVGRLRRPHVRRRRHRDRARRRSGHQRRARPHPRSPTPTACSRSACSRRRGSASASARAR